MKETIGFIGLGVMGLPMATRLLRSEYRLVVNDVALSRVETLTKDGAEFGQTPEEVTRRSQTVISMLPFPEITEKVVFGEGGILKGIEPGKTYIDMSTSSLSLTKRINEAVGVRGGNMLDAPVSGGEQGAINGTLSIMVGGDKAIFEASKEMLSCLGKNIYHVGESGSGLSMKLVNNLLYSIIMCGTAEALTLGREVGLDLKTMVKILGSSSASSYVLTQKAEKSIIPQDFTPGFTINLLCKDVDLALEMAGQTGASLLLSPLARQMYQLAKDSDLGDKDNSSIIKVFEKGIDIKSVLKGA